MAQRIIIASGVEIRDTRQQFDLETLLNARAHRLPTGKWVFPAPPAVALFEIENVFTMAEFGAALQEDKAWVVYSGHSRYGQGPAFGPARTPHCPTAASMSTNPWGQHFRMGWDATDTECVGDILEHGVDPVEFDITAAPAGVELPGALVRASAAARDVERQRRRGRLSRYQRAHPCSIPNAWRELRVCQPAVASKASARPSTPLQDRHYYRQTKVDGHDEFLTAVKVGHADLDAITLRCSVLFMGSCSSRVHYRHALVKHRRTQRAKCTFFLTSHVNSASHAATFVEAAFNLVDPTTRRGAARMVRLLNRQPDPGTVTVERP